MSNKGVLYLVQYGNIKNEFYLLPERTTWNRRNIDCEGRLLDSDRKSLDRCRP